MSVPNYLSTSISSEPTPENRILIDRNRDDSIFTYSSVRMSDVSLLCQQALSYHLSLHILYISLLKSISQCKCFLSRCMHFFRFSLSTSKRYVYTFTFEAFRTKILRVHCTHVVADIVVVKIIYSTSYLSSRSSCSSYSRRSFYTAWPSWGYRFIDLTSNVLHSNFLTFSKASNRDSIMS